jgi:D-threo-aldose 1-dehydrogenase
VALPTSKLPGTSVATSAIGFGCAGLFRIPQSDARRSVLDAAYDAGIRHFDVAPMYGLGLAEAELGSFLNRRRADVTVTTKFGIEPTLVSRSAALIQRPARALLAKRPNVTEGFKTAGQGPHSGPVGRLLYSSPGYNRQSAQAALERSLRALGTDYVDIFLLHDPVGGLITGAEELTGYLDEQCRAGRIRGWGVTGQPAELRAVIACLGAVPVIQHQDDIFEAPPGAEHMLEEARITFGALARAVPASRQFLAQSPDALRTWSERLGLDLAEEPNLPRMLLGAAILRNPAGPVLFSTTRPERARLAAEAATQTAGQPEALVAAVGEFAAAVRAGCPERIPAP